MIQRRISDSPDPAAPVNSGEPLNTIASREPPSVMGFIFEIMCWMNRKLPSLILGVPAPNRPLKPFVAASVCLPEIEASPAPLAAAIADECFAYLDAPVMRVASTDTFVGYAPQLEDATLPQQETFRQAYRSIVAY